MSPRVAPNGDALSWRVGARRAMVWQAGGMQVNQNQGDERHA
jgi:hypothetical protein